MFDNSEIIANQQRQYLLQMQRQPLIQARFPQLPTADTLQALLQSLSADGNIEVHRQGNASWCFLSLPGGEDEYGRTPVRAGRGPTGYCAMLDCLLHVLIANDGLLPQDDLSAAVDSAVAYFEQK